MRTCIPSHGLKRSWYICHGRVNVGNKNTASTHHPWRRNVVTSMVGLKSGHISKNLTQNGEPQRCSWERRRRKRRREKKNLAFSVVFFFFPPPPGRVIWLAYNLHSNGYPVRRPGITGAEVGWPGVSTLQLVDAASLICNFTLARTIVGTDPSMRYPSMSLGC